MEFEKPNHFYIVSLDETVKSEDLEKIVQIIDESGSEVSCTFDKFVEIFDQEGLAGFIL